MYAKKLMEVTNQVQDTPINSKILLTDPIGIDAIITDSKEILYSKSSTEEEKESAKVRIKAARFIQDRLLEITMDFFTVTPVISKQEVAEIEETTTVVKEEQAPEAKVIPLHKEKKGNKEIAKIKEEIKAAVEAEKHPALQGEVKRFDLTAEQKALFNINLADIKTISDLDITFRKFVGTVDIDIIRNYYLEIIATHDLSNGVENLAKQLTRIRSNVEPQLLRFHSQVENFKAKPSVKSQKQTPSRLTMAELTAKIKAFVAEGKVEEAFNFGTIQLRKLSVLRDDDNTKVIPHFSEDAFKAWFKEFAPEYVHVKKAKEEVITETPFKELPTYAQMVVEITRLLSENKLDEAKAYGKRCAVDEGLAVANGSGDVNRWGEDTFNNIFEDIVSDFKANTLVNATELSQSELDEFEQQAAKVIKDAILANSSSMEAYRKFADIATIALDIVSKLNIFKKLKKRVEKEIKAEQNPVVVDATTDIKKEVVTEEAPIVDNTPIVDATIFIRRPIMETHPKVWKSAKTITSLVALEKASKQWNHAFGWQMSLNACHDVITSGNIADAKDWTEALVDDWFNKFIITKNVTPVVTTEIPAEPKKDQDSVEQNSTTSPISSEQSTDGEKKTTEDNLVIKDKKVLFETCVALVMEGKEQDAIEHILSFANFKKHNDKWADEYMNPIRKEAKKRLNKTK